MASTSTSTYELRKKIFLVGYKQPQIIGRKLPTNLQALQVLFFWIRHYKLTIRESATLVVREVSLFWHKANIPIQKECRCIDKLVNLHAEHRNVSRHAVEKFNKANEDNLKEKLNLTFAIAHGNAMEIIDDEAKAFLLDQRSNRQMYIATFAQDCDSDDELGKNFEMNIVTWLHKFP